MSDKAESMYKKGKLEEARRLYEETLDGQREILDSRHPDTIATIACLALTLKEIGDAKPARALFKEALSTSREELGPRHQTTLTAMSNYAGFLRDQGRYDAAANLYEEAIAGAKVTFGRKHTMTQRYTKKLDAMKKEKKNSRHGADVDYE